ncbi:MAG: GNAT family N-acetyltransferase [Bryobacteraceae bacterium]
MPIQPMENAVQIRRATLPDAGMIAEFNAAMALETEHLRLDASRLLAGVEGLLADPAKGFYLVAERDGQIAGQMMITFEWSDWRNGTFWWIQSVYVRTQFRGQGVFRALYDHIERLARKTDGICGLRLYVEQTNRRAQATYERSGMQRCDYKMYEVDFVIRRGE